MFYTGRCTEGGGALRRVSIKCIVMRKLSKQPNATPNGLIRHPQHDSGTSKQATDETLVPPTQHVSADRLVQFRRERMQWSGRDQTSCSPHAYIYITPPFPVCISIPWLFQRLAFAHFTAARLN